MAYLEVEEMTTHIYEEDMDTISHGDDAAMMSAIDAAIDEVQGYLTKYDTGKIFAARGKLQLKHLIQSKQKQKMSSSIIDMFL